MEEQMNLRQMTEEISGKLLDTKYILEILTDMIEVEPRQNILISLARKHVECSFKMVENCRRLISDFD